jgi:hypothetical protein
VLRGYHVNLLSGASNESATQPSEGASRDSPSTNHGRRAGRFRSRAHCYFGQAERVSRSQHDAAAVATMQERALVALWADPLARIWSEVVRRVPRADDGRERRPQRRARVRALLGDADTGQGGAAAVSLERRCPATALASATVPADERVRGQQFGRSRTEARRRKAGARGELGSCRDAVSRACRLFGLRGWSEPE